MPNSLLRRKEASGSEVKEEEDDSFNWTVEMLIAPRAPEKLGEGTEEERERRRPIVIPKLVRPFKFFVSASCGPGEE